MSFVGNWYGFLGYYNHSRKKLDKAEKYYKSGMEKGMDKANYRLAYGVLLLKKGEFAKAKDIFSGILINTPKENTKMMAKTNLSLAYWKLGEIDTAIEMLEEVQRKYNNSRVYGTLGYLLIEKGDLDKALEYNLQALDYDDEDPVILDNLAQTYYFMGDIEKAKKYFKEAAVLKDDQADTLYYLGCIYADQGDIEQAKEKLNKALECNITTLSTITREQVEDKLKELS
jgi:tetratricopeptide (TPR) repeat protein